MTGWNQRLALINERRGDRQPLGKNDWQTPPDFFAQMHVEFEFTVDAAASDDNALLPRYWTKEEDALTKDWSGERVWCNPPYSDVSPWVEKASLSAACGGLVVMLLAPSIDSRWFHRWIWDAQIHQPRQGVEVRFLEGRLRFLHPDPERRKTDEQGFRPISGNMIVVFRPQEPAS